VHHAKNPEYIDKNYSGVFIVWDRLFGTFAEERDEPVYGTVKPLRSFNSVYAQLDPWIEMGQILQRTPGFVNKLIAPIAPPEWRPRVLGGPVEIPKVSRETQERYEVRTSRAVDTYVVASFTFVVLAATGLILARDHAPLVELIAPAVFVVFSLVTLAGLTESRRWATALEIARLVVLPLVAWVCARGTPWWPHVTAGAAAAIAAVVSAAGLWIARRRTRELTISAS
jgi:hypothetical protein